MNKKKKKKKIFLEDVLKKHGHFWWGIKIIIKIFFKKSIKMRVRNLKKLNA